jgi:hypothetical protein
MTAPTQPTEDVMCVVNVNLRKPGVIIMGGDLRLRMAAEQTDCGRRLNSDILVDGGDQPEMNNVNPTVPRDHKFDRASAAAPRAIQNTFYPVGVLRRDLNANRLIGIARASRERPYAAGRVGGGNGR